VVGEGEVDEWDEDEDELLEPVKPVPVIVER
jgi:hypothetical protein